MSIKVLLTGGGGFVGSHCLEYFIEKTDWMIYVLDSFRHKGTYTRIPANDRVKVFNHDLIVPIDRPLENMLMERDLNGNEVPIDYIFNLAADSAVERSISEPGKCWFNNCALIYNMLEFARQVKPKLFVEFSSDEVYGEAKDQPHKEWDAIVPSNVYSASKAAMDDLSIAYYRTYDVPVIITTCMNIVAERQDKEKFLPKLIWKVATGQTMEIYGEKNNIGSRFYIHAKSVADALIFLANKKPSLYKDGADRPDRYNIVGDIELNNLEVAQYVAKLLGKPLEYKLIPSEEARRGYDRRYALDGSKMASLGWKHPVKTLDGIEKIVHWTMENPHWII